MVFSLPLTNKQLLLLIKTIRPRIKANQLETCRRLNIFVNAFLNISLSELRLNHINHKRHKYVFFSYFCDYNSYSQNKQFAWTFTKKFILFEL